MSFNAVRGRIVLKMLLSKFSRFTPSARSMADMKGVKGVRNVLAESSEFGHHPNPELWQKVVYYICFPALIASSINVFLAEIEHNKHDQKPEFKPYEYMRIRTKPFPWGDGNHSLFHNPKVNPTPEGFCDPKLGFHWSH